MRLVNKFAYWMYRNAGNDGLLHIICSMILLKILWLIMPLLFAVITATVIGFCKEYFLDPEFSKKDIICNTAGIILCILLNI